MAINTISAEIKPIRHKSAEAALALQRLGFRIYHCDEYISVEGAKSLWTSTFNVSFKVQKKSPGASLNDAQFLFEVASVEKMIIPERLKPLIEKILFLEPPKFF